MFGNKKRDELIAELQRKLDWQLRYVHVKVKTRCDWIQDRISSRMLPASSNSKYIVIERADLNYIQNLVQDIKAL